MHRYLYTFGNKISRAIVTLKLKALFRHYLYYIIGLLKASSGTRSDVQDPSTTEANYELY